MRPLIAITMGDAAGVGPEIIAKTLSIPEIYDQSRPLVIGDEDSIKMGIDVSGLDLGTHTINEPSEAFFEYGIIDVLDLDNIDIDELVMGTPQAMAGRASVEYVLKAAEMALAGDLDAIVTAPLNKEAMNMGGYNYTGHTGLLAELSGVSDYAMMLTAGDFRVIHVSIRFSQFCHSKDMRGIDRLNLLL